MQYIKYHNKLIEFKFVVTSNTSYLIDGLVSEEHPCLDWYLLLEVV